MRSIRSFSEEAAISVEARNLACMVVKAERLGISANDAQTLNGTEIFHSELPNGQVGLGRIGRFR